MKSDHDLHSAGADIERLVRSEQELTDFFENAAIGLHWVGPDGIILRVNQAELDMLGYGRDEYVGRHIAEFHVDRPVIDDLLARLARGDTLQKQAARLRCKDGSVRDVLINSSARFDNGRLVHTRCFTLDVTERKQAEDALKAELADAKLLQEISTQLIHENDVEALYGRIMDAAVAIMRSDHASMQMYYPERGARGELRLLAFRGFDPDAARFWEWVRADSDCTCGAVLRTGTRAIVPDVEKCDFMSGTADLAALLKAGIRAAQSTPLCSRGGQLLGMISTHWGQPHQPTERDLRLLDILARQAADLIERNKAEQALRESEGRFRTLADALPTMIWVSDATKACTWFNRCWLDFTGRPMHELLGDGWAQDVHPEDFERCLSVYNSRFDAREPFSMEYRLKRYDGQYRWFVDDGIPRFDAGGVFAGYLGSCTDLTARKQAEAVMSEAAQRKDEFLAMLSHELRNPLAPIRNAVSLLQEADGEAPVREQARAILDRQVGQLTRLVDDLLDIARISRGSIRLRKEIVRLDEIVAGAIETSRPLIDDGGHQLYVDLPQESIWLSADRVRLTQVVANLLNNAARYTPRGGRIDVTARAVGGELNLAVRDEGIGIEPGQLTGVFDMFFQAGNGQQGASGGLGIGLALARQLVELHGGSIEARSEGAGRGSAFVVRVPLPISPVVSSEAARPRAAESARRVLVADDNVDAARSLGLLLRTMGHVVQLSYDGAAALETALKDPPEIVLLDIDMPTLDGFAVAARLREDPRFDRVPIVALTGLGQDVDRKRARQAGFDEHVLKPVDYAALRRALELIRGSGEHSSAPESAARSLANPAVRL
jgi:PAS domain S-box-containing protein